ncbi:uncharacterized protein [Antedon mediterranea]|uniref:uncharacterized protein n=1 Tax=Antedon mediterranea TaxID=105859 RepID=UPI003AF6C65D
MPQKKSQRGRKKKRLKKSTRGKQLTKSQLTQAVNSDASIFKNCKKNNTNLSNKEQSKNHSTWKPCLVNRDEKDMSTSDSELKEYCLMKNNSQNSNEQMSNKKSKSRKNNTSEQIRRTSPRKRKSSENNVHSENKMFIMDQEKEKNEIPVSSSMKPVPRVPEINYDVDNNNVIVAPPSPDVSDLDKDNESDDDLPDCFENTPSKRWSQLDVGDLVWAKAPRHPYWPAIVRSIKRTRASVVFMMENDNQDSFPLRNAKMLKPFSCPDRCKYEEKMKCQINEDEYKQVIQKANDYQEERVLGKKSSKFQGATPASDTDEAVYFEKSIPSPSVGPPKMDENCIPPTVTSEEDRKPKDKVVVDDGNALQIQNNLKIEYEKRELRLAKFIKRSKKIREHLINICTGKTVSKRHTLFYNMTKTSKSMLDNMGALPIYSEDVMNDINAVVKSILEGQCNSTDEEVGLSYIFNVGIPEAILFAIGKTRKVCSKKAEKIFYNMNAELLELEEGSVPKITMTDEIRSKTLRRAYRTLNIQMDLL